jgi:hypothetical protein
MSSGLTRNPPRSAYIAVRINKGRRIFKALSLCAFPRHAESKASVYQIGKLSRASSGQAARKRPQNSCTVSPLPALQIPRHALRLAAYFCVIGALLLASQGVPQTLGGPVNAGTLEGATQIIARGPVASKEAIKLLSGDGGGFFNANSAHPYEPFISRLFRGALSHLEFICRNGYVIGTVPGPSKGSRRRQQSTTDLERQTTWHRSNHKSLRNLASLPCDLGRDHHLSSSSARIAAATGSYGIGPGYVVVSLLTVPKRSASPC